MGGQEPRKRRLTASRPWKRRRVNNMNLWPRRCSFGFPHIDWRSVLRKHKLFLAFFLPRRLVKMKGKYVAGKEKICQQHKQEKKRSSHRRKALKHVPSDNEDFRLLQAFVSIHSPYPTAWACSRPEYLESTAFICVLDLLFIKQCEEGSSANSRIP